MLILGTGLHTSSFASGEVLDKPLPGQLVYLSVLALVSTIPLPAAHLSLQVSLLLRSTVSRPVHLHPYCTLYNTISNALFHPPSRFFQSCSTYSNPWKPHWSYRALHASGPPQHPDSPLFQHPTTAFCPTRIIRLPPRYTCADHAAATNHRVREACGL